MVNIANKKLREQLDKVEDLIKAEGNIKNIEFLTETTGVLVKKIKPNFKSLGPKYGKLMKQISQAFNQMQQEDIEEFEKNGSYTFDIEGQQVGIGTEDAEIITEDIPGLAVSTVNNLTVALDITITDELKQEGIARELINRIQNIRKDKGFEVTDEISVEILQNDMIKGAVDNNFSYICSETLSKNLTLEDAIEEDQAEEIELEEGLKTKIKVNKL